MARDSPGRPGYPRGMETTAALAIAAIAINTGLIVYQWLVIRRWKRLLDVWVWICIHGYRLRKHQLYRLDPDLRHVRPGIRTEQD